MDFLEEEDQYNEDKNKRTGLLISVTLHFLLLLLCLAPFFTSFTSKEGFQSVLVDFGSPDQGGGDVQEEMAAVEPIENNEENSAPKEVAPEPTERNVEETSEPVVKSDPIPVDVTESDAPDPVIIAEKNISEAPSTEQSEAEKAREAREAEEAAAAAKAAQEKEKYETSKKQFGDLFSKGQGPDAGGGDQGVPDGDPDAKVLEGVTSGVGEIGGGLADRGLVFEPEINDNSQKAGVVVIKVCVNSDGDVVEAKFTQRGSTTTDRTLVKVAEDAAHQYRFTPSGRDKQCGTIAIDFKLK